MRPPCRVHVGINDAAEFVIKINADQGDRNANLYDFWFVRIKFHIFKPSHENREWIQSKEQKESETE